MRFLEIRLGDRQLEFGTSTSTRIPFSFTAPVGRAFALLQTFFLSRTGGDMDLRQIGVSLITLFDSAQSATDGMLQVDFYYEGSTFELVPSPHMVRAEIVVLVVGV